MDWLKENKQVRISQKGMCHILVYLSPDYLVETLQSNDDDSEIWRE